MLSLTFLIIFLFIIFIALIIVLIFSWEVLSAVTLLFLILFALIILILAIGLIIYVFFILNNNTTTSGVPVKIGDSVQLFNTTLKLTAAPCGTLDNSFGGTPVTLGPNVATFIIESANGMSVGSDVNYGDSLILKNQSQNLVLAGTTEDPRQFAFIDPTNNEPGNTFIVNNSGKSGVITYGTTFALINSGLFLSSCNTSTACVNLTGTNCGNALVGANTAENGSTWSFVKV